MRWSCAIRIDFATAPCQAVDVRSSCCSIRTPTRDRYLTTSFWRLAFSRRHGPSLFKLRGQSSCVCKGRSGTDSDKILSGIQWFRPSCTCRQTRVANGHRSQHPCFVTAFATCDKSQVFWLMKLLFAGQPTTGDKSSSPEEADAAEQAIPPPTLASQLGSGLLLISPFFFWATSMVAMKVHSLHSKACLAQHVMDWQGNTVFSCNLCVSNLHADSLQSCQGLSRAHNHLSYCLLNMFAMASVYSVGWWLSA